MIACAERPWTRGSRLARTGAGKDSQKGAQASLLEPGGSLTHSRGCQNPSRSQFEASGPASNDEY